MHEMGALCLLIEEADKIAKENHARKVAEIHVDIGQLSGILPFFLRKYFPMIIENRPSFADCRLEIRVIPADGMCTKCRKIYNVVKNKGLCPQCQSRERKLLSGREFILKDIVIL